MPARARRALVAAASVVSAVLILAGLAVVGARVTSSQNHPPSGRAVADLPSNRPSSSGPIVVAVVLGSSGTIGSDAMAPYEVFADSPRFSVYTIAASGAPAPVDGGPAIVPTYTFADSAAGVAPPPDVVVVPAVTTPDGPEEAALRTWIVQQSRKGAHILGICAGARILAATGLLRGRAATSHWSWLDPLKDQHPEVHWVAGQRFVQDGLITTTAGITSGIPGALRVMKDLAGEAEAARVGQLVDYPGWSPTQSTDIPVQSFALSDLPVGLNAVVPWLRPTVGIALHDGIGEIDLASAFEVYTVSYPARTIPLTATGTVTTKHGMVLVTPTSRDAPPLTRLLAPGAGGTAAVDPRLQAWAAQQHLPVDAIRGPAGAVGFDGALEYLATQAGRATALSAAKMIDYPTTRLRLPDGGAGPRIPLLLGAALMLASGVACLPAVTARRRRRRRGGSHDQRDVDGPPPVCEALFPSTGGRP